MKKHITHSATPQRSSFLPGRVLKSTLLTLVAITVGSVASAATLEFDTSTTAGFQGGTSTWDAATTSVWTDSAGAGTTLTTWGGGSGTDAIFGSTLSASAALTVNSAISVNSLTINKNSVTLTRGTNAITLGAGGLTIGGAGSALLNTLVLTGTGGMVFNTSSDGTAVIFDQSFTGQVQILRGTFQAKVLGNFGQNTSLGQGVVGTSVLLGTTNSSNRAGILYTGVAASTNRTFTLASGGVGHIQNSGSGLLTLNGVIDGGSSTSTMVFSSQVASDLVLAAKNTYQGSTRIYGVQATQTITRSGIDNALPTGTTLELGYTTGTFAGLFDLNGYNQELAGLIKTVGSTAAAADISIFNRSATASTLELNIASGTNTYNGTIGRSGGNNLALTKTGTGALVLANASSYTGATTVSAGTLLVNGSTAAGSAVSVGANGTLGGTGVIAGDITVTGGTLAPGASIESLGMGGLTVDGGIFAFEVNTSSSTADLLFANDASASLSLLNGATLSLTDFSGSNTPLTFGTKFTLISYNTSLTGTFQYADDSTFTAAGNTWLINYNDTTAGSNFLSEAQLFGTSFVTVTAVPEPGSIALVIGGSGILLGIRRFRRQR